MRPLDANERAQYRGWLDRSQRILGGILLAIDALVPPSDRLVREAKDETP